MTPRGEKNQMSEYLTTRELAELLRLKERKIYELAASGEVPCTRATGKLLFPRRAVQAWMTSHSSGPGIGSEEPRPEVFLGSHDPLLEWALRESGCGCATLFDGSLDGLERFARAEGIATGLHLHSAQTDEWNVPQVASRFSNESVVLIELCWRERGLIVAPGNPLGIDTLAGLKSHRMVARQVGAGSHTLLMHLLEQTGLAGEDVVFPLTARSESDAALAVLDGKADAAFGLLGMARQFRLDFVPIVQERFDLLIERRAWFEPAMQTFVRFCASGGFAEKASNLGGYDVSGFGKVIFNA